MAGDGIKVNFAEIAQAAQTISSESKLVDQMLDDLRTKVVATLGTWESEAAEAYQQKQREWDAASDDLNKVLAAIGTAVQQAGDAYQDAENKNRNRW